MVHLVGGKWIEVKTLALGEVTRNLRGEVCMQHLSYFSRLSDAANFEQAALVETHRRGLERASEVCAVQDGAEWLQGLVDYHRADAVRILDFAHAAQYINAGGQEDDTSVHENARLHPTHKREELRLLFVLGPHDLPAQGGHQRGQHADDQDDA